MAIAPGTRIGGYEVLSSIGAGGMGEVYRARDHKLNRDVALKILPESFALDPDRVARFKREAQVLASLNHPNIAAIYGFEESNGTQALVLELVDGPTLANRIAQVPIPPDEALPIAKQIAEALEAAHEHGIIHRDLKPANIKVRPDGTAKVLDFGLAKALTNDGSVPSATLTNSPTITSPVGVTGIGVLLGTAPYMAPEQAKGKAADRRSDIWAFGCVLYEMLTGKRAFDGDDVSDTLAAILTKDPDWTQLPPITPPALRRLLHRALEKDRRRRLADIADARIEIEDARHSAPEYAPPQQRSHFIERVLWSVALAIVVLGATLLVRQRAQPPSDSWRELRLEMATPPTTDAASLAISPDGSNVVYVATHEGRSRLWLRPMKDTTARPLPKTEDASFPFWSPDSRSVAFFANGQLMRLDLTGEVVRPLAPAPVGRGGAWNRENVIVYAETGLTALKRISAEGGTSTAVTELRPNENSHSFPHFLPDGRHFVYYTAGPPGVAGVYVGGLDRLDLHRRLTEADAAAVCDSVGNILLVRQGKLFGYRLDLSTLAISGNPALLADQVAVAGVSANVAALSTSATGTVLYRTGTAGTARQFVWVDRSGAELERLVGPDRNFPTNPELAPDAKWLALTRTINGNTDLWMLDLARRGAPSRLTTDPAGDLFAVWWPDGERLIFSRDRSLFVRSMTTGREEVVVPSERLTALGYGGAGMATDISLDERFLLVRGSSAVTGNDVYVLDMAEQYKLVMVLNTSASERDAKFYPKGGWIAFQSDESGRDEIYIERFPAGTNKRLISANGGRQVRWRSDGRELYYIDGESRLIALPVSENHVGELVPGSAVPLFGTRVMEGMSVTFKQNYVVSPDGKRFLLSVPVEDPNTAPITVLLNWRTKAD